VLQIKEDLIEHIKERLKVEPYQVRALKYLLEIEVESYIDEIISVLYTYTRKEKGASKPATFAEVICTMGFAVRNSNKLIKNTAISAKTGGFLLYSFEKLGLIRVFKTKNPRRRHSFLAVEIISEKLMRELYSEIPARGIIEKLPSIKPHAAWKTTVHENGSYLVKTTNRYLNRVLNAAHYPAVFEAVNKSQQTGWMIHSDILEVQEWALVKKENAFKDIWKATSKKAQKTKFREARTIISMAKRFVNKTFYHLFYLDFRGRSYPATAYLHHQGSDVARGLLLRADKTPLGKEGWKWLLISAANNWGGDSGREDERKTDKIPLTDRYAWAKKNLEKFKSYADFPTENKGWMNADKPWQFLACCLEIAAVEFFVNIGRGKREEFQSNLECYIDGTCNGHQHLAALTQDEVVAEHVNLSPSEYPGDLYAFVAKNVWNEIEARYSELSPERLKACEEYINVIRSLKAGLENTTGEARREKTTELIEFKKTVKDIAQDAAVVFWREIKDTKERRKVLKRNVMTIPYGASSYGLGEQIIEDSKRYGIPHLHNIEYKFASFLGRLTYESCEKHLSRSINLLRQFERCGRHAEEAGHYLSWVVPLTGFPVTQHYVEGEIKKTWIQYGPKEGPKLSTGHYSNTYQVTLSYLEKPVPSKRKQAQGAAPNVIHSLDAAHLAFTIASADFPITTIHDSFGSHLGHMEELFQHVRDTFAFLYTQEPLEVIADSIGLDLNLIETGVFDVNTVSESEYAFS